MKNKLPETKEKRCPKCKSEDIHLMGLYTTTDKESVKTEQEPVYKCNDCETLFYITDRNF